MSFDPSTTFLITCFLALMLGALQLWMWLQDRKQYALASIGSAFLLGGIASILVSLRGVAADFVSIDLANTVFAIGYGLIWTGMRQFEQRRPLPIGIVAGAAVWLLACQVPAFYGNLTARVALMSTIIASYCVAAALELLRGKVSRHLPSRLPLAWLLLINACLHAARAPLLVLTPVPGDARLLPTSSAWFGFVSMSAIIVIVGVSVFLISLAKELAEQRSIAALAAARDASDRANEEKSRFLARMSHELRTLLNSVLGMAQSLARDPGLSPAQHERAATLERAGRHLTAIVNDVLDLGRVEAGRLELAPRAVDLRGLLDEVIDFNRSAAEEEGVALDLRLHAALPLAVLADPVRLRQILLNLLGNAVKFTPAGGQIVLAAQPVPAGLEFAVTDDGPGVPADQRERLFRDYERMGADAAGTAGTGLGLAITAALARAMGGGVAYAPGPDGRGSRFSATLPLPEAPLPVAATPRAETEAARLAQGLRILVVDDIAANRMVAEALLTQAGHQVQSSADGPSAIAVLEGGMPLPDAVLMDVHMPGMDGLEATARIRALPGAAGRVPVIAVTAEAAPEEVRACLEAGMDGHVAKPIDSAALLAAIGEAQRRRAAAVAP
ncbi:response regulator [Roseomonas terrae]|jgi:signal transduction histidine kinase/CheY-like chemotaxis protein|uniref:histidine kinase n=1 Tax=Neoroseomonas terrae TaxID=424799 RepID=A0ABS5EES1_9PROT|nr:response regulator [Neoroseomonas terrae]MBR0649460.1 response regulator [Neoroseomonas terrae]